MLTPQQYRKQKKAAYERLLYHRHKADKEDRCKKLSHTDVPVERKMEILESIPDEYRAHFRNKWGMPPQETNNQ